MITRRHKPIRRSLFTGRDILRLALVAVIVVLGATTWRQIHVAAAPAQTYGLPSPAQEIGLPVLLPPSKSVSRTL